jgi:hypothetical protein
MSDPNALQKTIRQWAAANAVSANPLLFLEVRLMGLLADVFRTVEALQSNEKMMLLTIARGLYENNVFPAYSEEGDKQVEAMLRDHKDLRVFAINLYKTLVARFKLFLENEEQKTDDEKISIRLNRVGKASDVEYDAAPSMEEMMTIMMSNTAMMMNVLASRMPQVQGKNMYRLSHTCILQGSYTRFVYMMCRPSGRASSCVGACTHPVSTCGSGIFRSCCGSCCAGSYTCTCRTW